MATGCDTVIVGAGPYGLSVAAHLRAHGADFRIFGRPLHTWRTAMPEGMLLKSDGFASSLSAPVPGATLGDYCRDRGLPFHRTALPVPLETFVAYGLDFQRRHVPDLEQTDVLDVTADGTRFRVTLADGEEVRTRQVVVAAGITHFAAMPPMVAALPPHLVSHSREHRRLDRFAGRELTVLGAGSSAVELAVAAARAGAHVRLVTRGRSVRFAAPAPMGRRPLLERVRKPGSGLGPGWRSRASCDAPDLFRYLPARWRPEIVRRHLGPSSPPHLREPFETSVELIAGRAVQRAEAHGDGIRLVLTDANRSDGGAPVVVDSDHVICATGYRADVSRLPFLDPRLSSRVRTVADAPVLDHGFASSVPGLYFVGLAAAVSFGPLMRFMYGDAFAARRITQELLRCAA